MTWRDEHGVALDEDLAARCGEVFERRRLMLAEEAEVFAAAGLRPAPRELVRVEKPVGPRPGTPEFLEAHRRLVREFVKVPSACGSSGDVPAPRVRGWRWLVGALRGVAAR